MAQLPHWKRARVFSAASAAASTAAGRPLAAGAALAPSLFDVLGGSPQRGPAGASNTCNDSTITSTSTSTSSSSTSSSSTSGSSSSESGGGLQNSASQCLERSEPRLNTLPIPAAARQGAMRAQIAAAAETKRAAAAMAATASALGASGAKPESFGAAPSKAQAEPAAEGGGGGAAAAAEDRKRGHKEDYRALLAAAAKRAADSFAAAREGRSAPTLHLQQHLQQQKQWRREKQQQTSRQQQYHQHQHHQPWSQQHQLQQQPPQPGCIVPGMALRSARAPSPAPAPLFARTAALAAAIKFPAAAARTASAASGPVREAAPCEFDPRVDTSPLAAGSGAGGAGTKKGGKDGKGDKGGKGGLGSGRSGSGLKMTQLPAPDCAASDDGNNDDDAGSSDSDVDGNFGSDYTDSSLSSYDSGSGGEEEEEEEEDEDGESDDDGGYEDSECEDPKSGQVQAVKGDRHGSLRSSRFKGVRWEAESQKWLCEFKRLDLGKFDDEEEAARAYDSAAAAFGRHQPVNFPGPGQIQALKSRHHTSKSGWQAVRMSSK